MKRAVFLIVVAAVSVWASGAVLGSSVRVRLYKSHVVDTQMLALVVMLSVLMSREVDMGLQRIQRERVGMVPAVDDDEGPPRKLAFLFLVRSRIPTEPIWAAFFGDAGPSMSGKYSIYSHPRPGYRHIGFFAGTEIMNRTKVSWGAITVARAEMLLIRAALADHANERFLLVSESCVPLHPLQCVYDFVMSAPSMVATWSSHERRVLYDFGAMDRVVKANWRKGHQWILLARTEAYAVASRDDWYDAFFAAHASTAIAADFRVQYQQMFDRTDGDAVHHNFADEHYIQTVLAVTGLESSGLLAASPTFIRFGEAETVQTPQTPRPLRQRRGLKSELNINVPIKSDWRATTYDPEHINPALLDKARAYCLYESGVPRASESDDPRTTFPQLGVAPWDPITPGRPECLFDISKPSLCYLLLRKIPNRTVAAYQRALWGSGK